MVCAPPTTSSISRSTAHAVRESWSSSRCSARCRSASRIGRLTLCSQLMVWNAEAEAHQVHRPKIELDERPFLQTGEDALRNLEVIEAEPHDVRVERQRVGAAERRDIGEAAVRADVRSRAGDD